MSPNELLLARRREPFVPFAIRMADGAKFEVHAPELLMVGLTSALVGIPLPGRTEPIFDRCAHLDLHAVVELLPLS